MDMKPGAGALLGALLAMGLAFGYFAQQLLPPWAYELLSDAVCTVLTFTCDDD